MVGPAGVGEERYVKPGEWMDYTIYFENATNATAAAQDVYVTLPKDAGLDWSTFELGEVVFGDNIDTGLSGTFDGVSSYALPGTNWSVRTEVTHSGDNVVWHLRIVDPTTADNYPADAYAGFLPPNDETGRGEGHLRYRVRVRDDAAANSVIHATAIIEFDPLNGNKPITTDPAWWNTVGSQGVAFAESEVTANEGETVEIRINGGSADSASSVKVYLTYNTAAAADVDLKKAVVIDGNRRQSDADGSGIETTNLKFPVTLDWKKGEVGEKVISIPIKADKTVEDAELFTLQLADAQGMELGEDRVCTVTIHDPGYDELAAKIAAGTASKKEKTAWEKLQKAKAPYIRGLADPANAGKVTGGGLCAEGKKVTLKATAGKGFVFVGWLASPIALDGDRLLPKVVEYAATTPSLVIDRSAKPAKNSATSTTITNVTGDATYYACFITSDEDKAAIVASVDGRILDPWVSKTETHALATNIWAGVYLEWPVAVNALSETKVKVAGLPSGLKFASKPVTKKIGSGKAAVTVTNVPANTIYGAPTAASKSTTDRKTGVVTVTPSAVKVTMTTAGKSSQTYQIDTTVDALPAWASGTFNGVVSSGTGSLPVHEGDGDESAPAARSTSGIVQSLAVASSGKISGKLLEGGFTWALSAPWFDEAGTRDACPYLDPEDGSPASEVGSPVFVATVIGKSGKQEITNVVTVAADAVRSANGPRQRGVVNALAARSASGAGETAMEWTAWQNLWKAEPFKTDAKPFAKAKPLVMGIGSAEAQDSVHGTISLKFAATGAVTASGKFITGTDAKGKDVVYSATCSAVLIPVDAETADAPSESGAYSLFLHFPPKAGKFDGYSAEIQLLWDGEAFSMQ